MTVRHGSSDIHYGRFSCMTRFVCRLLRIVKIIIGDVLHKLFDNSPPIRAKKSNPDTE